MENGLFLDSMRRRFLSPCFSRPCWIRFVATALLTWVFVSPCSLHAEITIQGVVYSTGRNDPLSDARVIILESQSSARTEKDGSFQIQTPEPGFYTFRIIRGSELKQFRKEIRYNGERIEFFFKPDIGPEVTETVEPGSSIRVIGQKDRTKLSRYTLTNQEIKRLPGVYGDALKAVTTLPGITPGVPAGVLPGISPVDLGDVFGFDIGPPYSNSRRGPIVLRGSGARASEFYLDGFKIQYPFHLGDQSSVLNNDLIKQIDVYTGTYPARFGNSTGGVISITGPDYPEKARGHINMALFLSDVYYETPLFGGDGYLVATARKSYPNYTLLKTYPDAIPADAKYANYHDGQYKIGYRPAPGHEFLLLYFGAKDVLQYTKEVAENSRSSQSSSSSPGGSVDPSSLSSGLGVDTGFSRDTDPRPPVGLDRSFHTQGFRYTFSYGGVFQNKLTAQISRFKELFELDFRSPFTGETIFGFHVQDARQELFVHDDMILELIPDQLNLYTGALFSRYKWELSMKNLAESQTLNPETPDFVETINNLVDSNRVFRALYDGDETRYDLNGAYLEVEWMPGSFRFTPGVRVEHFSLSGEKGVGPRMGAEYAIQSTSTILLAGAGRHFNAPKHPDLISEESANPNLFMEQSDHMALGIEQQITESWTVKLEGFRNLYSNLVTSDDFEVEPFSLRDNKRDLVEKTQSIQNDPYENRPLLYSNDGTGESKGVEIFIKKNRMPGENGWFGWISYTNSQTKRNNNQPRLTDDQKEDLRIRNLNREIIAVVNEKQFDALYYSTGELEYYWNNDTEELYDFDRNHIVSIVLNYKLNANWMFGTRWRYYSNVPYTPIIDSEPIGTGDQIGRMTFLPEYSEAYNSARLRPVHQLDLRIDHFTNYSWGYANWFIEFINFYARKNEESENFSFLYPYTIGFNPSVSYESTYMETPIGKGRRWLLPLVNIGMEIRF